MTTSINPELTFTLDDAVEETLGLLYGLELSYNPQYDRYRSITRALNRALRANALEHEWGYYASTVDIGDAATGMVGADLPNDIRVRQTGDDSVRFVDADKHILAWAYFLPRDAIHKYGDRQGLWCAVRRNELVFSRPLPEGLDGMEIDVPVMREPTMFRLPPADEVPDEDVLTQPVDFCYPDVIVARAAYMYALTDPLIQPRAQTLEAGYKDLMYQVIERDDRATDTPYQNDFFVPVQNDILGESSYRPHPLADERR